MSSDDKPSIAELAAMKRTFKTMTNDCGTLFDEYGDEIGTLEASQDGAFVAALTNAAPVLLEIAAAALALGPELVYLQGPLSDRLREALAKVRP